MKILLTNYTGYTKHLGCQLTSGALEALLRARFGEATEIVREPLGKRDSEFDILLGSLGMTLRALKMRHSQKFAAFRAADLVVVNGEGSFHNNGIRFGSLKSSRQARFHRLLDIAILASQRKEVWIVNHSVSGDDFFGSRVANIYRSVDYVTVREPSSRRYLEKHGFEHAIQSADAIFSLARPPAIAGDLKDHIVFTDSSAFGRIWSSTTLDQMRSLVDGLRKSGEKLAYFSLYTDERQKIHADALGLPFVHFPNGPQALGELASARILVTGRFHAAVIATKMGVPFVGFAANTHKMSGLRELVGGGSQYIDLQNDAPAAMIEVVAQAIADRDELAAYLDSQEGTLEVLARRNVGL